MSINPGTYRIKNVKSGTYLDASVKDQGVVHGWDSRPDNANQKWELQQSQGGWAIKNVGNGKYLHVHSAQDSCPVDVSDSESIFQIDNKGNGYAICVKDSGVVVDLDQGKRENGTSVALWGFHGAHQQQWEFEPAQGGGQSQGQQGGYQGRQAAAQAPVQYQGPLPNGRYRIHNLYSQTAFDLNAGANQDGTPITGWERGNGVNQTWELESGTSGYRLKNGASGTYAGFREDLKEGVLLSGNQQAVEWQLQAAENGSYQIHAATNPTFVIDLAGGTKDNGCKICTWENKSGQNQMWVFTPC